MNETRLEQFKAILYNFIKKYYSISISDNIQSEDKNHQQNVFFGSLSSNIPAIGIKRPNPNLSKGIFKQCYIVSIR